MCDDNPLDIQRKAGGGVFSVKVTECFCDEQVVIWLTLHRMEHVIVKLTLEIVLEDLLLCDSFNIGWLNRFSYRGVSLSSI